jgi:hypothetical protein
MTVKIVNHPLVLQKVSCLRDKRIKAKEFRDLVYELTLLLTMKATSTLDLKETKMVSLLSLLYVCYEAILMTTPSSWNHPWACTRESNSRTTLESFPSCARATE